MHCRTITEHGLTFYNFADFGPYDDEQSIDHGQLQINFHSGVTRADIEKVQ
jgi:hypothetical protein